jgi:hypothetical protein
MNYSSGKFSEAIKRFQKWETYIEEYRAIAGVSPDEITQMIKAFVLLKKFLGDDHWLANALQSGHPIFGYLANYAPWSRCVLIRMSQSLEALNGKAGMNSLLRRLRLPEKFPEGHSVMDFAYRFHRAGFEIAFDHKVVILRKDNSPVEKIPDLKIIDQEIGNGILVEVSALGYSREHERSSRTFRILWNYLMDVMHSSGLYVRGRFERNLIDLDDDALRSVLRQLDNRIKQVQATSSFDIFAIPGLIEVGIGFQENLDIVDNWAATRGIEESQVVSGPRIELKDLKRLVLGKLGKEARQLPQDQPGILIITTSQNLLFHTTTPGVISAAVAATIQRFPQLLGAVITHCSANPVRGETISISSKEYSFIEKNFCDALTERILLIPNGMCKIDAGTTMFEIRLLLQHSCDSH